MRSPFQTQSQWENEYEMDNSFSEDTQKKNGIKLRKKTLTIIGVIIALAITSAGAVYTYGRSIEGIWVRQMDDNTTVAGMTVEVRRNNGKLEGVIVAKAPTDNQFEIGQVKWFGIQKTGFGQYECYGLQGRTSSTPNKYSNVPSKLTISSNGERLTLVSQDLSTTLGRFQLWIKQKGE